MIAILRIHTLLAPAPGVFGLLGKVFVNALSCCLPCRMTPSEHNEMYQN
jgi:hypothetical protein